MVNHAWYNWSIGFVTTSPKLTHSHRDHACDTAHSKDYHYDCLELQPAIMGRQRHPSFLPSDLSRSVVVANTLVANVMESPIRWLHGFIFSHDFEIIRDSSYKSCSQDYFYVCRQQINVRKCSTNANCVIKLMAICWKGVESCQQCTAP